MTSAPFVRGREVNPLRTLLHRALPACLLPARPLPGLGAGPPAVAPPPRARAARRTLDRLLLLAIAASLGAALLERRARDGAGPAPIPSFPVDLAADPPERLRLLPGLGPARLAALLRDRDERGPPTHWADLERVPGIGGKTLEAWRASGGTLVPSGPSAPPLPPEGDGARSR